MRHIPSLLTHVAFVAFSGVRNLSLRASTTVWCRCCLLIVRSLIVATKWIWLSTTTVRCCGGRDHLTRLVIHMSLGSSPLNGWWLNSKLPVLVVLLLMVSSTVMALRRCWCVHLNDLLHCLVIILAIISSSHLRLSSTLWHFLSWTRSWAQASRHKPIVVLILSFLLSLLTETDWGRLLLQGWLNLRTRLLSGSSCILSNLLLLIIPLLSAPIVSSLWSSSLILVVGLSVLLLVLWIGIEIIQFVLPLTTLISVVYMTMSCSYICCISALNGHLRTSSSTTGSIVNCLSSLSVVVLSVRSSNSNVFTAIRAATRLLILLPITSSVPPLIRARNTWPSCTWGRSRLMVLIEIIFGLVIVLLVKTVLLHLIDASVWMTRCSRWTILLLRVLLELMRHISMCSKSNSTACLSWVSVLVIGSLWEILRRNCSWNNMLILWA